ncbi:MAG: formylmethanofuran dehydrogenase subunit C [Candidatus Baldrarchaeia archaeon]
MGEIILRPKSLPKVPLEADVISPDVFAGKSLDEIKKLEIWKGNKKVPLSEFFEVEGSPSEKVEDVRIIIDGNVARVKWIGKGMSAGEIVIKGDAGMHLGSGMRGGTIIVEGSVDDWCGAEMRGGTIEIKGNAGNYLGAAYRGGWVGMQKGTIIVHGSAGNEIGAWMANGKIVIEGDAGMYTGVHMHGGFILIRGNCMERVGGEMTNGKIIILGQLKEILPTFKLDDEVSEIEIDGDKIGGPFLKFIGDLADNGKGELYVLKEKNQHLLEG